MKKKILLFTFICACLISVLVVSSGAADWFSSFSESSSSARVDSLPLSEADALSVIAFKDNWGTRYECSKIYRDSSGYIHYFDGSWKRTDNSYNGSVNLTIYTLVGSDGFVSSGFHSAIGFAGTIAGELLDNSTIIIAIGLAVGVTLVGWGFGKVKSLIKGY